MNAPSNIAFRLATLLFAILLGMQCTWLLLAETSRPGIDRLPTDATAAAAAAKERDAAAWTALIGAIRGDLWAESAFTYADLLFGKKAASPNTDTARSLARTRASLVHALDDAPHQSGAWLLLAALASNDPSAGFNATEALKMSYYTGPSDQDLMPLRLRMAVNSDTFNDVEMRQFITRDLRVFLTRKQKSTIAAAYNAASPAGKRFIEQAVKDIDPSALNSLAAAGKTGQFLPD
jgi:hypothetical protein